MIVNNVYSVRVSSRGGSGEYKNRCLELAYKMFLVHKKGEINPVKVKYYSVSDVFC